jgi:hypothetical protein
MMRDKIIKADAKQTETLSKIKVDIAKLCGIVQQAPRPVSAVAAQTR